MTYCSCECEHVAEVRQQWLALCTHERRRWSTFLSDARLPPRCSITIADNKQPFPSMTLRVSSPCRWTQKRCRTKHLSWHSPSTDTLLNSNANQSWQSVAEHLLNSVVVGIPCRWDHYQSSIVSSPCFVVQLIGAGRRWLMLQHAVGDRRRKSSSCRCRWSVVVPPNALAELGTASPSCCWWRRLAFTNCDWHACLTDLRYPPPPQENRHAN